MMEASRGLEDLQKEERHNAVNENKCPPGGTKWTSDEVLILVREKCIMEKEQVHSNKWFVLSDRCRASEVLRSSNQCRKKWENLASGFNKIQDWNYFNPLQQYWSMDATERKHNRLPLSMERQVFDMIEEMFKRTQKLADSSNDTTENLEVTKHNKSPKATCSYGIEKVDAMNLENPITSNSSSSKAIESHSDNEAIALLTAKEENDSESDTASMFSSESTRGQCRSNVKRKRKREATESNVEQQITTAICGNLEHIKVNLLNATCARMHSEELEKEISNKGLKVNRELQSKLGQFDKELRRRQSDDLVHILEQLVNALSSTVEALEVEKSQNF